MPTCTYMVIKKEPLHLVKHPHAITRNSLLFVFLIVFSAAILEDINPVVSLRATLHLGTIHDNAIKTLVWWVEPSIFNFSRSRLMGSRKMLSFDLYDQSDQGPIHSLPTYSNASLNAFPYCCHLVYIISFPRSQSITLGLKVSQ